MWRTCKTQIASELEIPPQREVIHRIQFDNLEKLFYNEQHEECRSKFLENVLKYSKISTISPQVMNMVRAALHLQLKAKHNFSLIICRFYSPF